MTIIFMMIVPYLMGMEVYSSTTCQSTTVKTNITISTGGCLPLTVNSAMFASSTLPNSCSTITSCLASAANQMDSYLLCRAFNSAAGSQAGSYLITYASSKDTYYVTYYSQTNCQGQSLTEFLSLGSASGCSGICSSTTVSSVACASSSACYGVSFNPVSQSSTSSPTSSNQVSPASSLFSFVF